MLIRPQPYIRDDEGKKVLLTDPASFGRLPSEGDPRVEQLMRRLTRSSVDRGPGRAAFIWGASVPIILFATRSLLPAGTPPWMVFGPLVAIGIVAVPLVTRWFAAKESDRVVNLLLADGLCASCGYNFAGLDRNDAHVRCPECGAAWRTEQIVRAEAFAPGSRPPSALKFLKPGRTPRTSGRTRDNRGRNVGMADRAMKKTLVKPSNLDHEGRMREARPELALIGRESRIFVAAFFLLIGIAALVNFWGASVGGRSMSTAGVLFLVMNVGVASAIWTGAFAYSPTKANRVLLGRSLCASCASDLKGLEPAPDGCVECPECGAAWRLDGSAET